MLLVAIYYGGPQNQIYKFGVIPENVEVAMELGMATGLKSLEEQDRKRPDCLEAIGKKKRKCFR